MCWQHADITQMSDTSVFSAWWILIRCTHTHTHTLHTRTRPLAHCVCLHYLLHSSLSVFVSVSSCLSVSSPRCPQISIINWQILLDLRGPNHFLSVPPVKTSHSNCQQEILTRLSTLGNLPENIWRRICGRSVTPFLRNQPSCSPRRSSRMKEKPWIIARVLPYNRNLLIYTVYNTELTNSSFWLVRKPGKGFINALDSFDGHSKWTNLFKVQLSTWTKLSGWRSFHFLVRL